MTNNHVVDGAVHVSVKFSDGTEADATILGRYPGNDMALVKVEPSVVAGIEPVTLGSSSCSSGSSHRRSLGKRSATASIRGPRCLTPEGSGGLLFSGE